MKLEQQVCSLELSKRLRELGVKQESVFYWSQGGIYNEGTDWQVCYASRATRINGKELDWYSAFTVAELGEMLPKNVLWQSITGFTVGAWSCEVMIGHEHHRVGADTEADARASMLIYLIENNLITT